MSVALIFLFLMLFSISCYWKKFVLMKFVFRLGKKSEPLCFEGETLKLCQNFLLQEQEKNKHTKRTMGKSTRSSRNSQEEDLAYDTPERKRPNVANDGAAAAAATTNARRIDGNRGTVYYKYKKLNCFEFSLFVNRW